MLSAHQHKTRAFRQMYAEVKKCTRQLSKSVSECHSDCPKENHNVALDLVDKICEKMNETNVVEAKRFLRHNLWAARVGLEEQVGEKVDPSVRLALENSRNTCLDISWTRDMRQIPSAKFVTHPRPKTSDIPNFNRVNENFLRGGQPDQAGVDWLKKNGVKTILDLRGGDRENAWVKVDTDGLEVKKIDIPDFLPPTHEQVKEALEILNDPENQPVFVHCKAGVGRTGTITACWRVDQGESAEEALGKERINSYYGSLRQEDFVREFERYSRMPESQQPGDCAQRDCASQERSAEELWPLIHAYSEVADGGALREVLAEASLNESDSECLRDFAEFWRSP